MKKIVLMGAFALAAFSGMAQKKTTTSAKVSFDATTPQDAFPKADNNTVVAMIDTKTGAVAFEAQMKSFNFSNPKMQEHFNSPRWLDSEQFPTTNFKGKITNLGEVNFAKDGSYAVKVAGTLTLHGITKDLSAEGTVTVKGAAVSANAEFTFKLDEYNVGNAGGKVNNEPKITVSAELQ